jgi:choline dehydrogenase
VFRVKNVRRLRVVDASVIPRLLSGGSHAPVVMLAERAADFILGRKPLPPVDTTKKRHDY